MPTDPVEKFWNAVLSRQPERIRRAVKPLNAPARAALIIHLESMVSEEGWLPQQRESAQTALDVIREGQPQA
jgi:hypothetical protein